MAWKHTIAAVLMLALAPAAGADSPAVAPEAATGLTPKPQVTAERHMIAAAHPLAAEAGLAALRDGGSATDAMVAAQMVLGLVEPQSSGLGGGAFLVRHDGAFGTVVALDGRETAPMGVTEDWFLDAGGRPLTFFDAVVGGRSVATPGTVRLMADAHARWGVLAWDRVLQPAIDLAERGFAVSPRLAQLIDKDRERLSRHAATRAYFFREDGEPLQAGDTLKNPAYADTLRQLARFGPDAFYNGPVARDMVAAVRGADNPGMLGVGDLAPYRVVRRHPVCAPYRAYTVCGMGPPSSGMLTVGQILGMLQHFDLGDGPSPDSVHLIAEASRLAFADRGLYIADPDFHPVPTEGLLDAGYLKARAALIDPARAAPDVQSGTPPGAEAQGPDDALELPSTSHLSIVDRDGNAVALTTTIENGFGSRVMVRGFLLNNELTDFAFSPEADGKPVANRVEPGKRPRSSMAPTLVYGPDGKLAIVLGSPGGANIIGYVAKTLIAMLDWNLDAQAAASLPHFIARTDTVNLEPAPGAETLAQALEAKGHTVKTRDLNSGLHILDLRTDKIHGAADPRREGVAVGD
ncbi:MAG: gamma-glutamyltransferase [Alphaproteobacteria bacterium]|nr:gamma-glutamyltransferase [Alphaproteobacteria bacterium]